MLPRGRKAVWLFVRRCRAAFTPAAPPAPLERSYTRAATIEDVIYPRNPTSAAWISNMLERWQVTIPRGNHAKMSRQRVLSIITARYSFAHRIRHGGRSHSDPVIA